MASNKRLEVELRVKDLSAQGLRKFHTGVKKGEVATKRLDTGMRQLTTTAGRFRRVITGAFAGISGILIGRDIIRTVAEFERSMATVQAVTGATGTEFARLTDLARELGATTQFTAKQAAEGMLSLSRAGFSTSEALAATRDVLQLATAAQIDMGEAADFTASAVRQFGLDAVESTRAVDTMLAVSNRANTDVRGLAEALKYAGPAAALFNKSIEETSAAIGVLADRGIKGTLAGTGFRLMLTALAAPSEAGKRALAEMGTSVEQLAVGTRPLVDVLDDLGRALNTVQDPTKRAGLLEAIVGRRGIGVAQVLATNSEAVRRLADEASNAAGEAERMAEKIENTLSGSLKALRSALEEAYLSAGDAGFAGGLKSVVDSAAQAIRVILNMPGAIHSASDSAINMVRAFEAAKAAAIAFITVGVASAVVRAAAGFNTLRLAIMGSTVAQTQLNAAMRANPIGLLVAAVTGLIAYVATTRDDVDSLSDSMERQKQIGERLAGTIYDLAAAHGDYNTAMREGNKLGMAAALRREIATIDSTVRDWRKRIGETFTVDQLLGLGLSTGFYRGVRPKAIDQIAANIKQHFADALKDADVPIPTREWVSEMFAPVHGRDSLGNLLGEPEELAGIFKNVEGQIAAVRRGYFGAAEVSKHLNSQLEKYTAIAKDNVVMDERHIGGLRALGMQKRELLKTTNEEIAAGRKKIGVDKEHADTLTASRAKYGQRLLAMGEDLRILKIRNKHGKIAALVAAEETRAMLAGIVVTDKMRASMRKYFEVREQLSKSSKMPESTFSATRQDMLDEIGYLRTLQTQGSELANVYRAIAKARREGWSTEETAQFAALLAELERLRKANGEANESMASDTSNTAASMASAFNLQFFDPMTAKMREFADIMRSIFSSLASSVQNAFGSFLSKQIGLGLESILPASLIPSALGNVFSAGQLVPVQAYASGGVVSQPTILPLAGEAGPEAIMPLRRGPGGRLGVEAAGGGGTTMVVNYSPTIHTNDARGVRQELDRDKAKLMQLLRDQQVRSALKGAAR